MSFSARKYSLETLKLQTLAIANERNVFAHFVEQVKLLNVGRMTTKGFGRSRRDSTRLRSETNAF